MKRVILDVDTGLDDALAILLAVKSTALKVEAITAVSGNVHVDKASMNSLKVLEVAGVEDVPVAKGMHKPLIRDLETAEFFHGKDGLGNTNLPPPKLRLSQKHAVDLMIEKFESHPGEITLIPTGPLTNVASAILKEPKITERIKECVLMGGAFGLTPYAYKYATGGNPVSEWNVWVDPEAARIVFRSGLPITAVGLDVTTDPSASLVKPHLKKLSLSQNKITRFVSKLSNYVLGLGIDFVHLHDPMAVAVAIDRSLVKTKRFLVDVETRGEITRGQTVVDQRVLMPKLLERKKKNVDVCYGIDGKRLLSLFMDSLIG